MNFKILFFMLLSFSAVASVNLDADEDVLDSEVSDTSDSEEETTPFNENQTITRLKEEMNYLSTSMGTKKPLQTKSNAFNKEDLPVDDLEEKINFRSAAVKREDNLEDDEVDATELDGEHFKKRGY